MLSFHDGVFRTSLSSDDEVSKNVGLEYTILSLVAVEKHLKEYILEYGDLEKISENSWSQYLGWQNAKQEQPQKYIRA